MKTQKQNFGMLDIAKSFCALLVLLYHYFSERGHVPSPIDELLSLYAVAVAFFMVCSGFLTYRKVLETQKTERWQIIWKQFRRIMTIYLLWSIPYLAYTISGWKSAELTATFLLSNLQRWVFQSTFYTIWFLPSLAVGMVLSFVVTEKLPTWLSYSLALLCYLCGMLQSTYSFLTQNFAFSAAAVSFAGNWLGGARGWLFFGFPLMTLGRLTARNSCEKKKPMLYLFLSIGSMGLLLAEALLLRKLAGRHTGIDAAAMMPVVVWCVLRFCLSIRLDAGVVGKWLRSISVLVFVTQRLFLSVLTDIFPIFDQIKGTAVDCLLLCGGTAVFSVSIVALSKKWKRLEKLF